MANPQKKDFFLKHATVMEKFEHKDSKWKKKIKKEKKSKKKSIKLFSVNVCLRKKVKVVGRCSNTEYIV